MIEETIRRMETRLADAASMDEGRRQELLELLGQLRDEVSDLSSASPDQANSIAGYAQLSAHEATRTDGRQDQLDHALQGLAFSVKGFEESHPKLVQVVNAITTTLSNLGV